jgi:signal transduction histidine kinase/ActR/RegA family two-component response regulator
LFLATPSDSPDNQKHARLGKRMLGFAMAFGLLYAVLDSGVYLAFQYRHYMRQLNHQVKNLIESHRTSLSMSLYRLDEDQLHAELKDLIGHFGILRLQVFEPNSRNPLRITVGEAQSGPLLNLQDTLWVQENGQRRVLGLLAMDIDGGWPMQELKREALATVVGKAGSLLVLALLVIGLAHFGVTRHLVELSRQLESLGFDRLERRIVLKRLFKFSQPDEIDRLRDSLNSLLQRLEDGRRDSEWKETQRLESEKRHQANRKLEALGNLAGGIAHDINNILGIILLQTEMARDTLAANTTATQKLEIVLQAVDRAKEVVRQVLVFSRNSDGNRRPQSVTPAVRDALILLTSTTPKNIDLKTELEPNCGLISAEPADIQQILLNLGVNAIQAMGNQIGRLSVHLRLVQLESGELPDAPEAKPGLYAMLSVTDSGPGMPKPVLERIFEPYFTTKEWGKGTGLGLAMVHGIVKKLEGHILVHSEVGRGTTFRILLPVEEGALESPAPVKEIPQGKGEHLLVVEDEPLLRTSMQQILEQLNYRVTACENGEVALEVLQTLPQPIDLLLTDLSMPVMGGLDLSEAALVMRPDLRVAVCTGFASVQDMERMQARGIQILAGKPFLRSELAMALRTIFDAAYRETRPERT